MDRLPHAANLEALIAAHSTFLGGLLKGALLGGSASAQTGDLQAELQAALRSVAQLPNPVGKLQELVSPSFVCPLHLPSVQTPVQLCQCY